MNICPPQFPILSTARGGSQGSRSAKESRQIDNKMKKGTRRCLWENALKSRRDQASLSGSIASNSFSTRAAPAETLKSIAPAALAHAPERTLITGGLSTRW